MDPITVYFSVLHSNAQIIRYLQLHVWFLRYFVTWNLGEEVPEEWWGEGQEQLPEAYLGLIDHSIRGKFDRLVLKRGPENGFFILPSPLRQTVARLHIQCRNFTGMIPIVWRLEAPSMAPSTGALLMWCSADGSFETESIGELVDRSALVRKFNQILNPDQA